MTIASRTLDSTLVHIFSRASGSGWNAKRERRIAGLIELLVREVRAVHSTGKDASFEDKLSMARLLRSLGTANSVRSFTQHHRRNTLLREVNPYSKFGDFGGWLFEQLTERWTRDSYLLSSTIQKCVDRLAFVNRDSYSSYFREDTFFTEAECSRIHEEDLLD